MLRLTSSDIFFLFLEGKPVTLVMPYCRKIWGVITIKYPYKSGPADQGPLSSLTKFPNVNNNTSWVIWKQFI